MADYIAVSNTGKTITVSFSEEFFDRWSQMVPLDHLGRAHVDVEYRQGQILILPNARGRRVGKHSNGTGGLYVGMASRQMPEWPHHGKITYPQPHVHDNGMICFDLPKAPPPAKLRNTASMKAGAHGTRTDYSRDATRYIVPKTDDRLRNEVINDLHTELSGMMERSTPLGIHPRWVEPPLGGLTATQHATAVAFVGSNMLVEIEGQPMAFCVPLKLRMKIIAMLQADPQVSGDV